MKTAPHQLSRKTVCWVGGVHVLVLLLLALGGKFLLPEPKQDFIPLVGLPDQMNPRDGTPAAEGSNKGGGLSLPQQESSTPQIRQPQPPSPQPPAEHQEAPPPPTPPQPAVKHQETPPPPAKDDFPDVTKQSTVKPQKETNLAQPPAKPVEAKPKKAKVEVNLNNLVSRPADSGTETPRGKNAQPAKNGLNVGDVENKLEGAIGSHGGVPGGKGKDGTPGSPDGSVNGDWYRTLIKNTLERHWQHADLSDTSLSTVVNIRIQADGTILFLGMQQSSGNAQMDDSVIQAVKSAGKMSVPPPPGLGHPDYEDSVRFRLQDGF